MTEALPVYMQPDVERMLGEHTFTADEIIAFARKFDPQPFHMDAAAAKHSVLGGLCASGWHTASMWMRKQRDEQFEIAAQRERDNLTPAEFGPSPGFKNLKWLRPVYAGNTITFYAKSTAVRVSASKPGWYIMESANRAANQDGEDVLRFESAVFLKYPA